MADGEEVNAILLITGSLSYTPSGRNAPNYSFIARLTYWDCPYCLMSFSQIHGIGTGSIETILDVYNIEYDPDDGSILSINHPYATLIQ